MSLLFSQRGATLIYILFLLLAITALATISVRDGIFSLKVATNSQIQSILNQSSNSAVFRIQNPEFLKKYLTGTGLLGFIRSPDNYDKEMVFCFKQSQASFFDIDAASIIYVPAGTTAIKNDLYGKAGFCNPSSNTNFFTNSRKVVMTQVTVRQAIPDAGGKPLEGVMIGTDTSTSKIDQSFAFKIYVVSIVPNVSGATNAQIFECLSNRMSDPPRSTANQNVTDCLAQLGVPYNTQVVTYKYMPSF